MQRYSRHLIMPEVGMDGQLKLKNAKVLCIGTGGLGAPLGVYLAAAGVGRIGLVDFDVVDNSQPAAADFVRHEGRRASEDRGGRGPAARSKSRTSKSTRSRRGLPARTRWNYSRITTSSSMARTIFPTRYLVNDACVLLGKPNVYGSIFRFEGQATIFAYPGGPCYRCLYPEPPPPGLVPSCAEGGVLGVLPGIVGSIQAAETLKLILGAGDPLVGRLLLFDALAMKFRELKLRKNPECPVCGEHRTITKLIDYEEFCGIRGEEAPAMASNGAGNCAQRIESAARSGRRPFYSGRARAARISDLQPRRQADSAGRAFHAGCTSWIVRAKSWSIAAAESVRRKPPNFCRKAGFKKVWNLKGGILAWSDEVDPSVPKY